MRPRVIFVSALRRLSEGGRLVVLTGANHDPAEDLFADAAILFTATIDGAIYARHGTSVDTRLTVIDRVPASSAAPVKPAGHAKTLAELLSLIETQLPPPPFPPAAPSSSAARKPISRPPCPARSKSSISSPGN